MGRLRISPEPHKADNERSVRGLIYCLGTVCSGGLFLLSGGGALSDSNSPKLVKNPPPRVVVTQTPAPVSIIEAAHIIDQAEARERTPPSAKPDTMPTLAIDQMISVKAGQSSVLHLSVNADGVLRDHSLIAIHGLPQGTVISAGRPNGIDGWLLTPEDLLGRLSITPSAKADGTSVIVVLLLTPEGRVAREVHTKLVVSRDAGANGDNAPPAPAVSSADDIQVLLSHGRDLERVGYFAGARLFFQRAAEAGSAEGARALGETYDPVEFEKLGVHGLTPDPALAHLWYDRARALEAKSSDK